MIKLPVIALLSFVGLGMAGVYLLTDSNEENTETRSTENDDGCPGSGSDTANTTLKIKYREYFEITGEVDGESERNPFLIDVIIRDNYRLRRVQHTINSRGMPIEEQTRRLDELSQLGEDLGIFDSETGAIPQDKMAIYRAARQQFEIDLELAKNQLHDIVSDRIYVDAPPPAWSFEINNVERTGQREHKDSIIEMFAAALSTSESLQGISEVVNRFDLNQAASVGRRRIAGHECEVLHMSQPFEAETCQKKFGDVEVSLHSSWIRPNGKFIREALSVEENVCIPLSTFDPPTDIQWSDWSD